VVKGGVTTGERRSLFDAQKDLAAAKKKWETQVDIKNKEMAEAHGRNMRELGRRERSVEDKEAALNKRETAIKDGETKLGASRAAYQQQLGAIEERERMAPSGDDITALRQKFKTAAKAMTEATTAMKETTPATNQALTALEAQTTALQKVADQISKLGNPE